MSVADAVVAVRSAALAMLRTLKDELGSLDRVERWLRVTVFVHCADGFGNAPLLANEFTDRVRHLWGGEAFGTRSAVAAADLPLGTCFAADAILLPRPGG